MNYLKQIRALYLAAFNSLIPWKNGNGKLETRMTEQGPLKENLLKRTLLTITKQGTEPGTVC